MEGDGMKKVHCSFCGDGLYVIILVCLTTALFVFAEPASAQVFGDGSDGNLVITGSGTYHMTSDMNWIDLTVNSGATLETHGYIIRVSGTLINNGTITDSYSGGNGGAGGPGGAGGIGYDGHIPPIHGSPGNTGSAGSVSGAGIGGTGGGGGGGGGGAWTDFYNKYARGGHGGNGGAGGKGGGVVTSYAKVFDNNNLIHTNGFSGSSGGNGQPGSYTSYGAGPLTTTWLVAAAAPVRAAMAVTAVRSGYTMEPF